MAEKYDILVIGSGTGGYPAAIRCAQRGAKVAIVEKNLIGGTCLNCGCIPSKALLASAHMLILAKYAGMMGIDVKSAEPNWPNMQKRKNAIVTAFVKGLTGLIKGNKIDIIAGKAIMTNVNTAQVETESDSVEVQADNVILATGSLPIEIPSMPFDGQTIISSKEALELEEIPASMVIVGGGVIGCEMACVFSTVGCKVTIVEALERLVPMEDEWVSRIMEREFKKLGITATTGEKVTSAEKTASGAKVNLESGTSIDVEKVLVAVGRRAVIDDQTVSNLNLEMNGKAVKVNKKMQTNASGVYAVGDVVGTTYLAHGAFAEAEVAAVNATGGDEKMYDSDLIPRAVYTFPEIASVGKNEQACRDQDIDYTVGKSFFKANGRSAAHNEATGEIHVIKDNATDKIIGVTMVGAIVTELTAAARALIGTQEKITDISFPHPTVSEVLKEAAEDAFGLSIHNPPKA